LISHNMKVRISLILLLFTGAGCAPVFRPSMQLSSPAFSSNQSIPATYSCDGDNTSPELHINAIPENAQSLVLIMDDPDIPQEIKENRGIDVFDHWVLFNIAPQTTVLEQGSTAGTPGANGRGESAYTGPCPPTQYQPTEHRYFFKLYALDAMLNLPAGASKTDVEAAMEGHILEQAELIGTYDRS